VDEYTLSNFFGNSRSNIEQCKIREISDNLFLKLGLQSTCRDQPLPHTRDKRRPVAYKKMKLLTIFDII